MSLTVAFQMDPVEVLDLRGDSTFALALEAAHRGYDLLFYEVSGLTLREDEVVAPLRSMSVHDNPERIDLGDPQFRSLSSVDVVMMRQDPPFDMAYITATFLLEKVHPKTLVVNDPASVRNAPEKMFVTEFRDLMPPTLITSDRREIERFRAIHGDIVVKPLYGNGGAGVFRITPDDQNTNALLEMLMETHREPLVVQQYMPAVREGDRRIILVDGEPIGVINRVPSSEELRANLHVGARAEKATLTERDHEICATIGPILKQKGLIFTGIDIIGGFLTEINVTSPTCIRELYQLDGINGAALIWNAIEARLAEQQG